jgi:ABC-2 type transport system permease protein
MSIFKKTAAYCADEIKIIFTDPGVLLIMVLAMVIYPVFYSLAYVKEVIHDIPIAVVDLDQTSQSRLCSRMVDASEQLKVVCKPGSIAEAEQLFYDGDVKGVILIPEDFEKNILKGQPASMTVYCDASYFLYYKQVYAGAVYAGGTFSAGVEIRKSLSDKKSMQQSIDQQDPLKTTTYTLYNPSGGYGTLVMPGMMLVIMHQTMLIGIGMIGGTIRRRNRYADFAHQVAQPFGSVPVVLGKASAYVLVYLLNSLFAMVLLHHWLGFPDKSGYLPTLILFIPFLFAVAFLGLAISTYFRDRVHSLLFFVFLSPLILFFSGISWPTLAIPKLLYYSIAQIFPSTIAIPAYLRMRTGGAPISAVQYETIFLLVQMLVYFVLACISFKVKIKQIHSRPALPFS